MHNFTMEILGESIDSIGQDWKILGKPRGNYGFNNGRSIYFILSMVFMGNQGKRLENHRECLIGESWEKMGKSWNIHFFHGGSFVLEISWDSANNVWVCGHG